MTRTERIRAARSATKCLFSGGSAPMRATVMMVALLGWTVAPAVGGAHDDLANWTGGPAVKTPVGVPDIGPTHDIQAVAASGAYPVVQNSCVGPDMQQLQQWVASSCRQVLALSRADEQWAFLKETLRAMRTHAKRSNLRMAEAILDAAVENVASTYRIRANPTSAVNT